MADDYYSRRILLNKLRAFAAPASGATDAERATAQTKADKLEAELGAAHPTLDELAGVSNAASRGSAYVYTRVWAFAFDVGTGEWREVRVEESR